LAHVNEGKAQPDGHFYEHGKAFDTSTGDEVVADDTEKMAAKPSGKRVHKTTNPVKEFKGFEIDPTTGFPICQKTKELIDGTKPYCKSCFIFGHSQKLFTGCEIHKDVLACLEKEEEEKTNGNKVDKK